MIAASKAVTERHTILIIGTADTKAPELLCLKDTIISKGGKAIIMDVGVVGQPSFAPEISNHDVAKVADRTIQNLLDLNDENDENESMELMARGASLIAKRLHEEGRIDGMVAIGGTMGTDLAFDVALVLPIGFPKVIVSSVAFSHLVPPERIAADLMMILWAGGLWGVNSISLAVLEQAAGAVLGACRPNGGPAATRPAVAVTSLGQSGLKYLTWIKPELERRGYEVVVFHAVGMGGRAMESLIAQGTFVCVLDLALIEVSDDALGSPVTAGGSRLITAGAMGVPQIVAPGAIDGLDYATWKGLPASSEGQLHQVHNRLVSVAALTKDQRRIAAEAIARKLMAAKGPTHFVLPTQGFDEWDRPGGPLYDLEGLAEQLETFRSLIGAPVKLHEVDAHINDRAFADTVLRIFDTLVEEGLVPDVSHKDTV